MNSTVHKTTPTTSNLPNIARHFLLYYFLPALRHAFIEKIKKVYLGFCCAVYVLAIVIWFFTLYFDVTINMTSSLPGTLYVVHKGGHFNKGDLVAYRWKGGATYPVGTTFIKEVVGFPGDKVRRLGNGFWVNEHYVGIAKTKSLAGIPLQPADSGVIPRGAYFMSTSNPNSLDSRYAMAGNIAQSEIIGKAYEVF